MGVVNFSLWGVAFGVASVALAGCSTPTTDPQREFGTARSAWELADAAARAWDPTAILLMVSAIEPSDPSLVQGNANYTELEKLGAQTADPELGDGIAQAWRFDYVRIRGEEQTAFQVLVDARGIRKTMEDEFRPTGEEYLLGGPPTLGEWPVDSDAAARIAAAYNETWNGANDAPGRLSSMVLVNEDGRVPHWHFKLFKDYPGFGLVMEAYQVMNAQTGRVTPELAVPRRLGSVHSDTLSLLDPERIYPFQLGGTHLNQRMPHPKLRLLFVAPEAGAGSENRLIIERPSRADVGWWHIPPGQQDIYHRAFDKPSTGDYRVSLTMDRGVKQLYEFSWCAEGRTGWPDAEHTCGSR